MMDSSSFYDLIDPSGRLFVSLSLIGVIIALRLLLIRVVRGKSEIISESQRRGISAIKNLTWLLIFAVLLMVWFSEIRNFALSIAAVAIAIVIATKELILCVSGALLKATSGTFTVGDWVEIGEVRGEVIEYNFFATTIQEIEPGNRYDFTGKSIVVPNSLFLTTYVKNLNFMKRYVFHRFTVTSNEYFSVTEMKAMILRRLEKYTEHFIDVARRYNNMLRTRVGIALPCPESQVYFSTNREGGKEITISLFCPTNEAPDIEQRVILNVIDFIERTRAAGLGSGVVPATAVDSHR
jgi:small-conductance mechanosensitive channel